MRETQVGWKIQWLFETEKEFCQSRISGFHDDHHCGDDDDDDFQEKDEDYDDDDDNDDNASD